MLSSTCGGWVFHGILALFSHLHISIFNAIISICLTFLLFCHYNPIRSDFLCHYGSLWSHFDCFWRMAIMLNSSGFESSHHPRFKILLITRSDSYRLLSESKLSRVWLSSLDRTFLGLRSVRQFTLVNKRHNHHGSWGAAIFVKRHCAHFWLPASGISSIFILKHIQKSGFVKYIKGCFFFNLRRKISPLKALG